MTRRQRTLHRMLWLVLFPGLAALFGWAVWGRPYEAPRQEAPPTLQPGDSPETSPGDDR